MIDSELYCPNTEKVDSYWLVVIYQGQILRILSGPGSALNRAMPSRVKSFTLYPAHSTKANQYYPDEFDMAMRGKRFAIPCFFPQTKTGFS